MNYVIQNKIFKGLLIPNFVFVLIQFKLYIIYLLKGKQKTQRYLACIFNFA